jgi:hypothetical protein
MKTSESVDKVLPALMKVKSVMGSVAKSADNPFFRSKYADLNSHIELVEPLLMENGILLTQSVLRDERGDYVETRLTHSSGQWVSSSMSLVLVKNDMQAVGSAVTYARRYTLGALLSLKAIDDDGEAAVGRDTKPSFSAKTASSTAEDRPVKKSSFRKSSKKTEADPVMDATPADEVDGWN